MRYCIRLNGGDYLVERDGYDWGRVSWLTRYPTGADMPTFYDTEDEAHEAVERLGLDDIRVFESIEEWE